MPTSIPITLNANPVPVGITAVNINDLLGIVSEYVTGSISQNVSFFIQGATAPQSNQGIFYNTSSRRFEDWNNSTGSYVPISELQVGDLKTSLRQSDDAANGWILLDGRTINSITTITQAQKSNLVTLFGANSSLPNYSFLGALVGLPSSGAFSNITNPTIQPPTGTFNTLPVSSTYSQSELINIRNSTELLLGSTSGLQSIVANMQTVSEQMLTSLLSSTSTVGPRWFVFCGYPS